MGVPTDSSSRIGGRFVGVVFRPSRHYRPKRKRMPAAIAALKIPPPPTLSFVALNPRSMSVESLMRLDSAKPPWNAMPSFVPAQNVSHDELSTPSPMSPNPEGTQRRG